jgi:hypothetical protein
MTAFARPPSGGGGRIQQTTLGRPILSGTMWVAESLKSPSLLDPYSKLSLLHLTLLHLRTSPPDRSFAHIAGGASVWQHGNIMVS